SAEIAQRIEWAGLLHEVGYTVSHLGFHKHGSYIVENADMPGFSSQEQHALALLVLGCRGGLAKVAPMLGDVDVRAQLLALRLAVLLHHARGPIDTPRVVVEVGRTIRCAVAGRRMEEDSLSAHLPARAGDG